MLNVTANLNLRAATIVTSLSIALCAITILIVSANAQQLSASDHEAAMAHSSQATTVSASTVPTGTITMPMGDPVPQMRFPIIYNIRSDIGTATLPGTSTLPDQNQIYYVPFFYVQ